MYIYIKIIICLRHRLMPSTSRCLSIHWAYQIKWVIHWMLCLKIGTWIMIWLVVSTPLKNNSQLGWLFPIIIWENKTCSKPPTRWWIMDSHHIFPILQWPELAGTFFRIFRHTHKRGTGLGCVLPKGNSGNPQKVGHPELVAKTNHVSHAGKTWYFSFFLGIPRKEPVATDCMVCMVYNSTLPICWPHSGSFSILQPQASAFFRSFSAFASASFCRICRKISRKNHSQISADSAKSTPWTTQFQPWFLVRVKVYLYKCAWGLSEARLPFPSPNSGTKLITSTRNDLHEAGSTEFLYRKTLPSTRFSLSI